MSFKFEMPQGQELHNLIEFCKVMAQSPFYTKLGAAGILSIYLTAKELDLPFMACLNKGIHVVEGAVTISAKMMHAMIIRAGHQVKKIHLDENYCTLLFIRSDRKPGQNDTLEYTYKLTDAQAAGYLGRYDNQGNVLKKSKDNWTNHLKPMLFARALSGGANEFMSDIILNLYVQGELDCEEKDVDVSMPEVEYQCLLKSTNLVDNESSNTSTNNCKPLQIVLENSQTWEEFCLKHDFFEGTLTHKYLHEVVKNTQEKKPDYNIEKAVNAAINNEETFITAFNKWKSTKQN